jgi:hypothetical protein
VSSGAHDDKSRQRGSIKSHEVLKAVVSETGTKRVAHDLRVSTSLVYKWCEEPPPELGDEGSGARNPLDRLDCLYRATQDRRPIEWLCRRAGGYFVETNQETGEERTEGYIKQTQTLLAEFSDLLRVLSEAIASEGRVDLGEAEEIRRKWDRLQGRGEAFVRACERGHYDPERTDSGPDAT